MRSKKALVNTLAGIAYELVAVVCGLILPRLILSAFGSKYNGITASISQFISCIALMKAGIGGVSRAALYKALAGNDKREISSIVKATQGFMRKIAMMFILFIAIFALIFSNYMMEDFPPIFTISLVLIIGISTFGEYFFGMTYEILLSADQRQCVYSIIRIFTTILNTIVAAILIYAGFEIRIVKLASSLVFLLNPLIVNFYARRKYGIIDDVEPDNKILSQRWDAVGHEIANFVNTNTDVMVLTVFSNLLEVSVYTVYNTVIIGVRKVVNTFVNGFGAAFGNMYAKGEYELMEKNFRIYELIVFSLASIIYSITAVMFVPYAGLYTSGITDVNYERPLFAYIMTLAGAFSCIRIPYQNIVTVAGHFKQTRNGAFVEAIINIVISIIAVNRFGLVGVAFGTIIANLFRTIQYAVYMSKNVLIRSISHFVKHTVAFLFVFVFVSSFSELFLDLSCNTVQEWIFTAVVTGIVTVVLTILVNFTFWREDMLRFVDKIKRMINA